MKKLTTALLTGSALLFNACGSSGGGGSTPVPVDPMTENDIIQIVYNYPVELCTEEQGQELETGFAGYGTMEMRIEGLDVTCETYGRTNDGGVTCMQGMRIEGLDLSYPNSCVIGYTRT